MFNMQYKDPYPSRRRDSRILLACFSGCAVAVGVTAAHFADPMFLSMMRSASGSCVSIVDLLSVVLFPFLITFVVSFIGKPYLLFPVCFIKSMQYAMAFTTSCITFASAGWLVTGFLLVTDSATIVLLYWYCIRHIDSIKNTAYSDLLLVFILSLAVCIADYLWISPYLATLMNS